MKKEDLERKLWIRKQIKEFLDNPILFNQISLDVESTAEYGLRAYIKLPPINIDYNIYNFKY